MFFQRLIDDDWSDEEREDRSARYQLLSLETFSATNWLGLRDDRIDYSNAFLFFLFFERGSDFFPFFNQDRVSKIYLLIMDAERKVGTGSQPGSNREHKGETVYGYTLYRA